MQTLQFMPDAQSKEYFHSLTSLRGIAALWVAIGHISWTLPSANLVMVLPAIRQGYLAVDFFFILSGFVLAHAYKTYSMRDWSDYLSFCRARIARIFPIHIFILLIFTFAYFIFRANGLLLPGEYGAVALGSQFLLLHTIPIFGKLSFFAWNYPAWTLVLEVWWFIAIVGGILVFNKFTGEIGYCKIFKSRKFFLALIFSLELVLVSILFFKKSPAFINDPNFYSSLVRSGLEFLAGFFMYRAFLIKKFELKKYEVCVLYFLILLGIFAWSLNVAPYILVSYWLMLIPFVVILALDKNTGFSRVLTRPGFLYLGNISYSLYLVHGPIERTIATIYPNVAHTKLNIAFWYILFVAGTIFCASLAYKYVEKPVMFYFKNKRARGNNRAT